MCLGILPRSSRSSIVRPGSQKPRSRACAGTVSVALCPEAGVGDWVLVHVGFALAKIDEEQARETLVLLEQMGEAYELELAR